MMRRCLIVLYLGLIGACASRTTHDPGPSLPDPTDGNNSNNTVPDPNQGPPDNGNNTPGNPNGGDGNQSIPGSPNRPPPQPIPPFVPSPFVRSTMGPVGAYLSLNGAPYRMVGFEASVADVHNYCDWTAVQQAAAFDAMAANPNINTVRMWFLQSAGGPPDSNNVNGWRAFDGAIAVAKDHNMRIIPTLGNQWGDCEPTLSADSNARNYKTLAWYQGGYKDPNDGYPLSYRDFVRAVAERYAGEPTIAFWQLMNEAEAREPATNQCPNRVISAQAIRAFADDMVDVIRSVDGNHLINLGTQDNGYCGVEDANSNYLYIHDGKIDICEVHSYDAVSPALPFLTKSKIDACNTLGKPIFMGEMGFCRVPSANDPTGVTCVTGSGATNQNALATSLPNRARYFDARFQAGFTAGLSGMLIWQWSPLVGSSNNTQDQSYGVGPGDPVLQVMQKY